MHIHTFSIVMRYSLPNLSTRVFSIFLTLRSSVLFVFLPGNIAFGWGLWWCLGCGYLYLLVWLFWTALNLLLSVGRTGYHSSFIFYFSKRSSILNRWVGSFFSLVLIIFCLRVVELTVLLRKVWLSLRYDLTFVSVWFLFSLATGSTCSLVELSTLVKWVRSKSKYWILLTGLLFLRLDRLPKLMESSVVNCLSYLGSVLNLLLSDTSYRS